VNANDAALTELATAQSGSMVADNVPNAPASGNFDLVLEAAAGSALGSSGAPYTLTISAIDLTAVSQPWPPHTLRQAFHAADGWQLSGTGPDYQCTQTFPIAIPVDGQAAHWPATPFSSWPHLSAKAPRSPPSSKAIHSSSSNPHQNKGGAMYPDGILLYGQTDPKIYGIQAGQSTST